MLSESRTSFFFLFFFFSFFSLVLLVRSLFSRWRLSLSLCMPTTLFSIGVCKSPRSTRPSAYRTATCVTHVRRSACVCVCVRARVITYVHGLTVFAWQYYSTPSIRGLVTLFFVGYRMLHSIDFGRVGLCGDEISGWISGWWMHGFGNKVSKKILTNLRRFFFLFFFVWRM